MTEPITNYVPAQGDNPGAASPASRRDGRHCGDPTAISMPPGDGATMNWRHLRRRLAAVRGVWDLAVLANLARGVIRPSDLIEAIRAQEGPISWTVLTRTLRRLEKEGYVGHKKVSQLPRVTRYWLTPAGWRLVRWLTQLDASCQETDPGDDHPAPPPQRGSAHPGR